MKPEGTSKLRSGVVWYKFSCPKVKWKKDIATGKYHRVCHCERPCTFSPCGRMIYIYPEKDLRTYPGILRRTLHPSFGRQLWHHRPPEAEPLHSDLLLTRITQLIDVVSAAWNKKHQYIRSLMPLIEHVLPLHRTDILLFCASGSWITDILSCVTLIIASCLHFGQ